VRRLIRTLSLTVAALGAAADARAADWLITPFVGSSFGTKTSYVVIEPGAAAQLTFGASAALLSHGILGVEADWGYAPRFFESDNRGGEITGSNVTSLTGSVIVAAPLSVTRESLRPYLVGGFGLIHAAASDALEAFSFNDNFAGMTLGGGAIGLITPRTGFRFDIRQFRSLSNGTNALTGLESARLSFWRATVGVTVRFAN
jgi:hypothetical protein